MLSRRDGGLFGDDGEHMKPTPPPELPVPENAIVMRVVHWPTGDRPCLVRCEHDERNTVRIKKLATICGLSCKDALRTSRIPISGDYCAGCLAGSARGVLR
jgi:hypothetical protein